MARSEPEELLRERRERLERALQGKAPDRVPTMFVPAMDLQASYAGVSVADFCFDWDAQVRVALKWGEDFNVDGVDMLPYFPPGLEGMIFAVAWADYPEFGYAARLLMGPFHDALRDRWTRWPGRELPPSYHPQFIGGVFMKPEEYGQLAENPLEFITGVLLPRAVQAFERYSSPAAHSALMKLGAEVQRYYAAMARIGAEAAKMGYPSFAMGWGYAPLDLIGDFMRMPTNVMLDLRRRPDDVKAAVEALTPLVVKAVRSTSPPPDQAEKMFGSRIVEVFIPLHLNEMLPPKLFEEFYWPSLKKVIEEAASWGLMPTVFFEGDFTPFLHYILELPKGRVFGWFEKADLRKVREVLGDHIVVAGGIPVSVLMHADKDRVFEESCKLIRDVKEPGGFVFMGSGVSPGASTKIENLWAAIEAVRKCGVY